MLDAHSHEAPEDLNGVFGDELLEGDEKGGLNGDAATDGRRAGQGLCVSRWSGEVGLWYSHEFLVAGDCKSNVVEDES